MPDWHEMTTLDRLDLLLMVAGAGVAIMYLVRWVRSGWRDPLRGAPLRPNLLSPLWVWLALVGYLFSGPLAGLIVRGYDPGVGTVADVDQWRSVLTGNLMLLIVIGLTLWVGHSTFHGGLAGFGLAVRSPRVQAGMIAAGWLVAIGLCMMIARASEWLVHRLAPDVQLPDHSVFVALEQPATPVFVRIVAVVGALLLAPLGEEFLFRGILQTGIRKLIPPKPGSLRHRWIAIGITAAMFGSMHLMTYQHVAALTVFGFMLGFLYERSGSLWVPVAVHMLFNGKTLVWYWLQT